MADRCEITSMQTLEPTIVKGGMDELLPEFNLAAAQGKQFVLLTEIHGDGTEGRTALETRNITRVRELEDDGAFLGR